MQRLTKEQAAIIGAYTGALAGPFDELHEYIEKIMGRSVWTHEMASERFEAELRAASKADFLSIAREVESE